MRSLTSPADWYLMRGSGVVALILFTLVVALGIATVGRLRLPRMPRFATQALHRNLSLLAVVFLGVHIVTALADPYAHVSALRVFLPVPSSHYDLLLGMGALAIDLLLAVVVTSLLRHHLSQRLWKGVHWLAYASWPIAFVHSVGIGTDKGSGWFTDVAVGCLALVAAAVGWRLLALRSPHPKYLGAAS
jgi:predicted ferric reductase